MYLLERWLYVKIEIIRIMCKNKDYIRIMWKNKDYLDHVEK